MHRKCSRSRIRRVGDVEGDIKGIEPLLVSGNGELPVADVVSVAVDGGADLDPEVVTIVPSGDVNFLSYRQWEARELTDPKGVTDQEVLAALLEIIAVEGPMPCRRAYRLYSDAAGIGTIDPRTRSIFNKAIYRGVQKKLLADRDEIGTPGQMDKIVRLAGRPAYCVRERGERSLGEIPPSEIAAALQVIAQVSNRSFPEEAAALFEELLSHYGLERAVNNEWQTQILERALAHAIVSERGDARETQLTFAPTP
jgi:hypothetical protein